MAFPTDPLIFDAVREHLAVDLDFDWTDGNVTALLVDRTSGPWTPDPDDDVVGTILAAGAVETSGTRTTLTGPGAAISGPDDVVYWTGDPITYPGVLPGEAFDTLVLFRKVTDDSDSYLIAAFDLGGQSGDGADVLLTPDAAGYLSI